MPPTGASGRRRGCDASSRFISSLSSWRAAASSPSMMSFTRDRLRVVENSPSTADRSPRSRASRARSFEICSCLVFRSRFRMTVSPRITNSSSVRRAIKPSRSARAASRAPGSPILVRTSSRMMAPKPQQMTSRNDRLKPSADRRRWRLMASPSVGSGTNRLSPAPASRTPPPPWDRLPSAAG